MNKHKMQLRLERCEERTLLSHVASIVAVPLGLEGAPHSGYRGVTAALRTNHAVYKVGQTVDMRLTLTNHTHHKIDLTYSTQSSPLAIWHQGRVVWDAQASASSNASGTTQIQIAPRSSVMFTQQLTAAAAGAFGVHSGIDPNASARYFRVIGHPNTIYAPGQPNPINPIGTGGGTTTPGQFPIPVIYEPFRNRSLPRPVMPPIIDPNAPMSSASRPTFDGTTSTLANATVATGKSKFVDPTGQPNPINPIGIGGGTITPGQFPVPVLYE